VSLIEEFVFPNPYCKSHLDLIDGDEAQLVASYNHITSIAK